MSIRVSCRKKHTDQLNEKTQVFITNAMPTKNQVFIASHTQSHATFIHSCSVKHHILIRPCCCLIVLVFARGAKATSTTLRAVQRLKQNQEPYKLVTVYNFMGTTPEDWNSNAVQPLKERWKIVYMYTTPLLQQFTRFIMHTFRGEWIVQNYKSIWSVIHAKARKWQH